MQHLTIGQLANSADVPTSTVRYYERRGLLKPDARSNGNYRLYSTDSLERLRFVRSAQAAGFTLTDITALLEFQDGNTAPCKEVQDLISNRLTLVADKIEHLKVVDTQLRKWKKICRNAEREGRCAVLSGLQSQK